eukprot:9158640-Lingulodinium_polyedra.AAC.1
MRCNSTSRPTSTFSLLMHVQVGPTGSPPRLRAGYQAPCRDSHAACLEAAGLRQRPGVDLHALP